MRRRFDKKRQHNRGFTLVELVIVIAILAILVGLLAPQYGKYVEKSRKAADVDNLEEMAKAFQTACAELENGIDSGTYSITITSNKTTFLKDADDINDKSTGQLKKIYDSMTSTLGNDWKKTKLKSPNWDVGTAPGISVTFTVKENGLMSALYSPGDVKDFMSAS